MEKVNRKKIISETIVSILESQDFIDGETYTDKMCKALIDEACAGNVKAFEIIRDSIIDSFDKDT